MITMVIVILACLPHLESVRKISVIKNKQNKNDKENCFLYKLRLLTYTTTQ